MHITSLRTLVATLAGTFVLVVAAPVLAASPQFSNGKQISTDSPFAAAQVITDAFSNKSVYGKLQGATPVDIYTFTSTRDGEQTIDLMERKQTAPGKTFVDPVLILADPTTETEAAQINLPSPGDAYHYALITQIDSRSYTEPALLQKYSVIQEQTLNLKKDKTYYLVVVPSTSSPDVNPYVIKFGTSKSWTASDVVTHFSSWFRLETGNYANSSPFAFNAGVFGLILMLLGLAGLVGLLIAQEVYALFSGKSKAAGYLLIKMQPYARAIVWIGLWLLAIGAYVVFSRYGWVGIPFVLSLLFVVILINMLYLTFKLSRRVEQLEVSKKEAVIPFDLRKRWFFSSMVSLFSYGAFIVYFAIYLIAK